MESKMEATHVAQALRSSLLDNHDTLDVRLRQLARVMGDKGVGDVIWVTDMTANTFEVHTGETNKRRKFKISVEEVKP